MKDPFQSSPNSYEILGIPQHASVDDVQQAFKKAVAGQYRDKAMKARQKLINETDRAVEDFFIYDDDVMQPFGSQEQVMQLLQNNRSVLTGECGKIQNSFYPEVGHVTHVLALLWYWTAEKEEEKYGEKISAGSDTLILDDIGVLENAWSKTIAHFIPLLVSTGYLEKWLAKRIYNDASRKREHIEGLEKKLRSHLENRLQNYHDKHLTGNGAIAQMYGKMLDYYRLELSCAIKLKSLDIEIKTEKKGNVRAGGIGKLFVEEHGDPGSIREALSRPGLTGEKKQIAEELLIAFSPYAHLLEKINKRQFQQALDEIEKLPKTERSGSEVVKLTIEALRGLLRYCITNRNTQDLLGYIRKYFKSPTIPYKNLVKSLAEEIDSLAREIKDSKPDEVVEILEWANKCVPEHDNIKLRLSELYFNRGIKRYKEGFKNYKQNPSEKNKKEMEMGEADVKKAIELNPADQYKIEQLRIIQGVLNRIRGGGSIPPDQGRPPIPDNTASRKNQQGVDLLNEAQQYVQNGDPETALKKAEQALGLFKEALQADPHNSVFRENVNVANQALSMIRKLITQKKNKEGVDILNSCNADYEKYMSRSTPSFQKKLLNDLLYIRIELAVELFNQALNDDPLNATYRENKRIAEQMFATLNKPTPETKPVSKPKPLPKPLPKPMPKLKPKPKPKPRTGYKDSPGWTKPITRFFLVLSILFLAFLIVWELKVNLSLF